MVPSRHFVVAVVGPTATGKSTLAEALAGQLDGEIVSADSMQVYCGMDIGTAKVPLHLRGCAYHCIDLVKLDEGFSAFAYQKAARKAFHDIWSRGRQPILCGGTGLYVRAALEDFVSDGRGEDLGVSDALLPDVLSPSARPFNASSPEPRSERRRRLNAEAAELGPEAFHAKLAAIDAKSAALIHPNNVRRVVRAFEWLEEGGSYAEQAAGFASHNELYPSVLLGLDMPREQLYARINARVLEMMDQGLLEEVGTLCDQGYGEALTALQAIGYKELLRVVSGEEAREAAVTQIQQATRKYAKRQLSWFRRDERINWLDALLPIEELTEEAMAVIARKTSGLHGI